MQFTFYSLSKPIEYFPGLIHLPQWTMEKLTGSEVENEVCYCKNCYTILASLFFSSPYICIHFYLTLQAIRDLDPRVHKISDYVRRKISLALRRPKDQYEGVFVLLSHVSNDHHCHSASNRILLFRWSRNAYCLSGVQCLEKILNLNGISFLILVIPILNAFPSYVQILI